MKKIRRQVKRFESPFIVGSEDDPITGRGYRLEPHGRFHGQRIGGTRLSTASIPNVARDFWSRSRNVIAPIDYRLAKGLDRYGGKFFGVPSRESIQVDRVASKSFRQILQPDRKPTNLLCTGEIISTPGNGADYSMEFGKCTRARQVTGGIKSRDQLPRGEVRFFGSEAHLFSSRQGLLRSVGIPLGPKSLQLRRGKNVHIGVISVAGEPDIPIAQFYVRRPKTFDRLDTRGREGKVLRFPIPITTEPTETRTQKFRSPITNIIRPLGGDLGSCRFGAQYDETTEYHAITLRNPIPPSRRLVHGIGSRWIQIKHPAGEAWTLPGTFRSIEAPPADRPLSIGRGERLSVIPRPLGKSWTFPFRFRSVEPPSAGRKLAAGRGATAARTPRPEGIARTDPWRFRLIQTVLASAMIRDRIAGARRLGSQSREIFDTTDTSRLPIYIDLVWDNEEPIEIQYESEIDIDLEVA